MTDLQTWMSSRDLNDSQVADLVAVSQATISRIRRYVMRASPELAVRLEALTGIPAWEFVKPINIPNSIGASPRADGLAADAATLPSEISPLSDGSLSDDLPDSWSISDPSQDEAVKSPPINTANLGQPAGELTGGAR